MKRQCREIRIQLTQRWARMKNTFVTIGILTAVLTGCIPLGRFRSLQRSPYETASIELAGPRQSPHDHAMPYSSSNSLYATPMYYSYVWQGYRGVEFEHDIYGTHQFLQSPGSHAQQVRGYEFVFESEVIDDDEATPAVNSIVQPAPVTVPDLVPVPVPADVTSNDPEPAAEPAVVRSPDLGPVSEPAEVRGLRPRPPLVHMAPAPPSLPAERQQHRIPRNVVPAPVELPPNRIPLNVVPEPGHRQPHRLPRNHISR